MNTKDEAASVLVTLKLHGFLTSGPDQDQQLADQIEREIIKCRADKFPSTIVIPQGYWIEITDTATYVVKA